MNTHTQKKNNPRGFEQRNRRFPPFQVSQCSSLTLKLQEVMKFDTCAVTPIAMRSSQLGCYIFLDIFFLIVESLVTHFLPNKENSITLWMRTPTYVSV